MIGGAPGAVKPPRARRGDLDSPPSHDLRPTSTILPHFDRSPTVGRGYRFGNVEGDLMATALVIARRRWLLLVGAAALLALLGASILATRVAGEGTRTVAMDV